MKKLIFFVLISASLITCSDSDPCEGITCENDGFCVNGQCDCTVGYEGPNCGTQTKPSSVLITKILITKLPAVPPGGGGWDVSDGPDIYVEVYNETDDQVVIYSSTANNINTSDTPFTYDPTTDIELNPDKQYSISIYDEDVDADDFMGGIIFNAYSSTNNFPLTRNLDAGGPVTFTLDLDYEF